MRDRQGATTACVTKFCHVIDSSYMPRMKTILSYKLVPEHFSLRGSRLVLHYAVYMQKNVDNAVFLAGFTRDFPRVFPWCPTGSTWGKQCTCARLTSATFGNHGQQFEGYFTRAKRFRPELLHMLRYYHLANEQQQQLVGPLRSQTNVVQRYVNPKAWSVLFANIVFYPAFPQEIPMGTRGMP